MSDLCLFHIFTIKYFRIQISKRELDEAIAKEKAMMNWQLAHVGSDSESGSDSDLDDDIDITKLVSYK